MRNPPDHGTQSLCSQPLSRVAVCTKQIVRHVCSQGLQPGDRLPSQQELRALLGVSNNTLTPAMRSLVEAGIVTRRKKVGTVLSSLEPLSRIPWSIGIATINAPDYGPAAFFANLHHRVVVELSRFNCQCRTYVRRRHPQWPQVLTDFPRLVEDLRDGALDGLVMLTTLFPEEWHRLADQDIPVCHVGHWSEAPCGVAIDLNGFKAEAESVLTARGCRHLAISDMFDELPPFPRGLASPQHADGVKRTMLVLGPGIEKGRQGARELLGRCPADRPDGLIIPGDYAAQAAAALLAEAGDYRPHMAVVTNRQMPLTFALPTSQWELDFDELVVRTAELIRGRLLCLLPPDHVERIAPRLITA